MNPVIVRRSTLSLFLIAFVAVLSVSCSGSDSSVSSFSRAIGSEGGAFAYVPESLEAYVNEADLVVRGRIVDVSNHVKEKVTVEDISYEVSYYHLVVEVTEVIAGSLGDGEWSEGVIHVVMSVGDDTSFGAIDGSLPGDGVESVQFLHRSGLRDPQRAREEPGWTHLSYGALLMRGEDGTVSWGGDTERTPDIFLLDGELASDRLARSYDGLLARIRAAAGE
jgi:hypothetical protein